MAEGNVSDLLPINQQVDDNTKGDSGVESAAPTTSSSPTPTAIKMVDGQVPAMVEFFKKMIITEEERKGYHDLGWLPGHLMSSIPEVEFPTVDDSNVMCFESQLIAGLGLPPSKFLVTIMSNLGYGLVHFNPNAITA
jgi:hypothetical protein